MSETAGTWKPDAVLAEEREQEAAKRKPSRPPKEVKDDGES